VTQPPSHCSFCGRGHAEVRFLIAAPGGGAHICDDCAGRVHEVVAHAKAPAARTPAKVPPVPRDIKAQLDEYVIEQEDAKRALAVAVYNHHRRLAHPESEIQKSNVLLVGPSGTGKTLLAQTLAKSLDVPFAIADATTLTEAGYVGDDEAAEQGGVPAGAEVLPEDLMEFGLIPELIGRLPLVVRLEELSEEALVEVLTKPRNAFVRQYKKLMAIDGVSLEFEPEAIELMAERAEKRNTGARGLRAIIEEVMSNVMYEAPSDPTITSITITKECVEKKEPPIILRDPKKQALPNSRSAT